MTCNYASTEAEARKKFDMYKSKDPFPSIASALLNSADIMDYVSATGMIWPFDERKLKSASYELPLLGKIYYWDGSGKDCSKEMYTKDDRFEIKRNSIAYVYLNVSFRVPDYIALRFNLRILHVHQGLLLGTGPLVDPGFEGHLLVPLHNLTANDYELVGGDGFIWVEFTKLNMLEEWKCNDTALPQRKGNYIPFPESKKNKPASYYFDEAVGAGNNIRSSIPDIISNTEIAANRARQHAENSQTEATNAKKYSNIQMWVTIVATLVVLAGMGWALPQVVGIISANTTIMSETNYDLRKRIDKLEDKIKKLEFGNTTKEAKPAKPDANKLGAK